MIIPALPRNSFSFYFYTIRLYFFCGNVWLCWRVGGKLTWSGLFWVQIIHFWYWKKLINHKDDQSLECNRIMAINKYQSARKCRICNTMFQNRVDLQKHKNVTHSGEDRTSICPLCNRSYCNENELKNSTKFA